MKAPFSIRQILIQPPSLGLGRWSIASAVWLGALAASGGQPAGAQPIDRSPLPPALIAPVVAPPVAGLAPLQLDALELSVSAVKVPPLLKRLRAKELTPLAAWESGQMDGADILYLLGHSLDRWGGFFWDKDPALRRALVQLLVERDPQQIKEPRSLPAPVRLWLADYYGSRRDARVLELCESLLAEQPQPQPGENALAFQAVERMAWYYRDLGQLEQAARTWERFPPLVSEATWSVPDAMMEAARLYGEIGQGAKAQALYSAVPRYGDGWLSAMANYDECALLIKAGRHEEARQRLARPIEGRKAAASRLGAQLLLAYSYYRNGTPGNGEWTRARQLTESAARELEQLPAELRGEGLSDLVTAGLERLPLIEAWQKAPFHLSPSFLNTPSAQSMGPAQSMTSAQKSPNSVKETSVNGKRAVPDKRTVNDTSAKQEMPLLRLQLTAAQWASTQEITLRGEVPLRSLQPLQQPRQPLLLSAKLGEIAVSEVDSESGGTGAQRRGETSKDAVPTKRSDPPKRSDPTKRSAPGTVRVQALKPVWNLSLDNYAQTRLGLEVRLIPSEWAAAAPRMATPLVALAKPLAPPSSATLSLATSQLASQTLASTSSAGRPAQAVIRSSVLRSTLLLSNPTDPQFVLQIPLEIR